MNITSAAGILAILEEPEPELKSFALTRLDSIVDKFWPEISESIEKIEILSEDANFNSRQHASLVASKVYFHLGDYTDSLSYALGAGTLFDVNSTSEYVETIISKAIDNYTEKRAKGETIDARLEGVVNQMFTRCFRHKQYRQSLGIALETKRMDKFEESITASDDKCSMLSYAFRATMSFVQNIKFRNEVLKKLVDLYRSLETPDYLNMCQCLIFLDDPVSVAVILNSLLKGAKRNELLAYQMAFDLYESATQQFLSRILQSLKETAPNPNTSLDEETKPADTEERMETDEATEEPEVKKPKPEPKPEDKEHQQKIEKLSTILKGEISIDLHLQFLIRNNHTDMQILKMTKDAVRVSICHNATVIANAFMHTGTTSDQFLRNNLEWLSRATNWAKFTATASLGLIHRGHEDQALKLMQAYLPRDVSSGSGYAEGGSLYALGLIHANHGGKIIQYLYDKLKEATNEMIRHGGCLGLGLAAMGTHRDDVYEQLKMNLYQDDAVTGEAAGIAMGLVMIGSKSQVALEHMIAYAHDTQHEKILRGLAVGIALTMYGCLEEADAVITSLLDDKDAILRRSAMYTVAMAYAGTGNNGAIRKLLHVAVSDVNNDVRRAAVEAMGFVLFRTPEACPSLVSLLAESYNPHVRYGAAMALGIACAGSGLKDALNLLEPLSHDSVAYVRQGALVASALVLIQQSDVTCPKHKEFRQLYAKVIADKHEDVMAKFGAILAQGIIDAGGRNVTVSLQSRTGHTNMQAIVGLLVFTQFWYWYPLSHFLSLAFTPSSLIALNADLKMPKIKYRCNAKPSTYAYPPMLEEKKSDERKQVETAVLSITNKVKNKKDAKDAEKKKEEKKEEKMEVEEEKKEEKKEEVTTKKEKEDKKEEEKKKEEPLFEMIDNPARVMKQQLRKIQIDADCEYTPMKDVGSGGFILLQRKEGEGVSATEELVEPVTPTGVQDDNEKEPEPPEAFTFNEEDL